MEPTSLSSRPVTRRYLVLAGLVFTVYVTLGVLADSVPGTAACIALGCVFAMYWVMVALAKRSVARDPGTGVQDDDAQQSGAQHAAWSMETR